MNTTIRTFTPVDTASVIALWQDCGLTRPWNNPAKDIKRKLAVNDELFLVAEQDQKIIGCIMGGYDGHRGWINYLAVCTSQRKLGLGRQLMGVVEQRLLALGCPKINLQIRAGNDEVVEFYRSLGFSDDECISFGKRLIPD